MRTRSRRSGRVSPGLLRTRFQFSLLLCFMWVGIIFLRLFYLQVVQHNYYQNRANRQRQSMITLLPERGAILDRKARELAISIAVDSIYAVPDEMTDAAGELSTLSSIIPVNTKELLNKGRSRSFVWIARKMPRETVAEVKRLKLPGVYFTQESRRFYPNKELAAHVIGFVGLDNRGLSGVEYQYDHVVSGIPGKIPALRDAKKRLVVANREKFMLSPTAGRTLQLTIDAAIQHIAEQELAAEIEAQDAKGGSVIVMNPYTGEILALANYPFFNPNAYANVQSHRWKNRAIQDYYEPGSTFKTVVAAAALDRGLVTPEDRFDCQMGAISLVGHIIHDHKRFGVLSVREILQKSSDVGMIKIGLLAGPQTLVNYTNMFGFGRRSGIDLPGETTGIVRDVSKWSAISIGAFSIGQEIGVTAIQVIRMMSAIANGGFLVSPHCVARISDSSGKLKSTVFSAPQAVPIKHETIATLQEFLKDVVLEGTGGKAAIPGYSVAGKTGTAQKIGPSRTYRDGGVVASFVGYAPASRPAISMIAVIDEPKKLYHGGDVAAPLFRRIGQQVLKYLDIPPDQIIESPVLEARSASPRETAATIYPEGVEPAAYTTPPETHHKLEHGPDDGMASELVMPYLYGKTIGEIVEMLSKAKIQFRLLGTGTVVKQWPAPGTLLRNDDLCIITLSTSSEGSSGFANLNATRK